MNYIIMDLEWNQPFSKELCLTMASGLKFYGEIIEIGAVKLNARFEIVDFFREFVKPKYYKKLHPMVKKITAISRKDLAGGIPFPEAIQAFRRWCGKDSTLMTWGNDDVPVLCDNLEFFDLDKSWAADWYNLQTIFGLQTGNGTEQKSLQFAMEYFKIPCELRLHDAFNDAFYTAQVCSHLDLTKGVGNYDRFLRLQREQDVRRHSGAEPYHSLISTERGRYPSKRAAFGDRRFAAVHCEDCGIHEVPAGSWMRQSNEKYIALAHCERHGIFLVRMKFRRVKGGMDVHKVVWRATEEMIQLYRNLAEKSRQRKEPFRSVG